MGYYSNIKKNETMFYTGKYIEPGIIMLSEKSQTEKTNITCVLSYVEYRSQKD
jgi:hypothetical protein